jgi:2-phosphoglycerate kinase
MPETSLRPPDGYENITLNEYTTSSGSLSSDDFANSLRVLREYIDDNSLPPLYSSSHVTWETLTNDSPIRFDGLRPIYEKSDYGTNEIREGNINGIVKCVRSNGENLVNMKLNLKIEQ